LPANIAAFSSVKSGRVPADEIPDLAQDRSRRLPDLGRGKVCLTLLRKKTKGANSLSKTAISQTAVILVSALLAVAAPAAAGEYPDHTITFVDPQAPGGATGTIARIFATAMEKVLGQPIVVENRAGAGSTTGIEHVAKSAPDGYTLGIAAQASLTTSPLTIPNVGFDPIKDFAPVYNFGSVPVAVIVNAELGPKTLKELIDYAKAHPGELNYSSAGTGTGSHFFGASFTGIAGIDKDTVHIPYQGGSQAATAVAAGESQFYVGPLAGNMLGVIQSDKVIALAVSGDKRIPQLPDVPTFTEAGLPEYSMISWYGLVAPAGTPAEIVEKLNKAGNEAAKTPEVQKALETQSVQPNDNTPAQFADQIKKDYEAAKKIVDAGLYKVN
jgi:tripartite-type tricarboxylate transporter receptor subunit TctC